MKIDYSKVQRALGLGATLMFFLYQPLSALHIVGGEVTYECLGNNQYQIQVDVYRDCAGTGAAFDNPAYLHVYDGNNNLIGPLVAFNSPIEQLPINSDICVEILPTDICVEATSYEYNWTVPPGTAFPITLAYLRYSRNSTIQNLVLPDETGSTYYTTIPEIDPCNSSAVFNDFPPVVICTNNDIFFDHSATDLDGDSLVYELCTPVIGGSLECVQPGAGCIPPGDWSPPYPEVTYVSGFDAQYPLPSDPAIAIDSDTGLITGVPTELGQYVIAVCVSEYRDGELINTVSRDFQFNVAECSIVSAVLPPSVELCTDGEYTIDAIILGADNISWTPTTGVDDPTSATPTVTESGTYTVTAINDEGCSDTASITVDFVDLEPLGLINAYETCSTETSDLQISDLEPEDGWTYQWEPAELLDDANAVNPLATVEESTTFTLTVTTEEDCQTQGNVEVFVYQTPEIPDLEAPEVCTDGEEVAVELNGPEPVEGLSYEWSPADLVEDANSASTTALVTGSQEFVLMISSQEGCSIEATTTVEIYELTLELEYEDDPSSCAGDPVLITANATEGAELEWQDESTDSEFLAEESGTYTVIANIEGCTVEQSAEITINVAPELDLGPDLLICDDGTESLDATLEGAESYLWNDGTTTPDITVDKEGLYEVTVSFENGCEVSDAVDVSLVQLPGLDTDILLICEQEDQDFLIHVGDPANPDPDANYLWTDGSTENSYLVTKDDFGWLWVEVSKNGCTKRDSIDIQVYLCTILPVELLDFKGQSTDRGHKLLWTSASEIDQDHYLLEQSDDGLSFKTIQRFDAAYPEGGSYEYLHTETRQGSYYRLRMVDQNGDFDFSSTIYIESKSDNLGALSLHPIPATDWLNIGITLENAGYLQIDLLDLSGREISSDRQQVESGFQQLPFSLGAVPSGVYFVKITQAGNSRAAKIIVK